MSSATFFQPSRGINKMQLESYAMEKLSSPASPLSRWNWFSAVADAKVCPSMLYLDYSACFSNQWSGEDLDGETVIQDLCFCVVLTTIYQLSSCSIFVHFHTFKPTQLKPSFQLFGADLQRGMFECVGQKLLDGQSLKDESEFSWLFLPLFYEPHGQFGVMDYRHSLTCFSSLVWQLFH